MSWMEVGLGPLRSDMPAPVSSAFFKICKPRLLRLSGLGVDVWVISLRGSPDRSGPLWQILGPEERRRGEEFHRQSDSARYVLSHAALRILLAHYAANDPRHFRFVCGAHGKPAIDPDLGLPDIRFNLSHSGNLAVLAVNLASEVGIDIERIQPARANMAIAERFFSPREIAALRALPEPDQVLGFFSCWTRKEAFLKGRGDGLSVPLKDFDVSLTPQEPPELLGSRIDPSEVDRWRLFEVPIEEGYVACLAIDNSGEDDLHEEGIAFPTQRADICPSPFL